MTSNTFKALGLATGMIFAGLGAQAQESTNRVAANTDWSVFEETNPRECWAVSAPKGSENTRDGQVVAVRRGEILLMVFSRPGNSVTEQVAFTGGYPFAGGSTVNLRVGDNSFDLYTEGEWAWPATPDADTQIVAALKRGASAVLTARSSRGTQTQDTFSLLGFTAASEEAVSRCAS